MIEKWEEVLGRKFTEEEMRYITWLNGWGNDTVEMFNQLFSAFYKAGQEDAEYAVQVIEKGERED